MKIHPGLLPKSFPDQAMAEGQAIQRYDNGAKGARPLMVKRLMCPSMQ
jgi:hypothetical protein